MYRLLIVDDEPRHRDGLANLIGKLRPEYHVFKAKNGNEALGLMADNPIDIVFSDIRMPQMDGLQLLEHLDAYEKPPILVVLSGYRQFEYAQKAISLGVCEYLLKPVDAATLKNTLEKIEREITANHTQLQENENALMKLNQTLPIYNDHLMNQWVAGHIEGKSLSELRKLLPPIEAGTILLTEINAFRSADYIDDFQAKQFLKVQIEQTLGPAAGSVSFSLEDRRSILVTVISTRSFEICSTETQDKLHACIRQMKEDGLEITIALGSQCEDIILQAKQAFEDAKRALSYQFFLGSAIILSLDEIMPAASGRVLTKYREEEELLDAVRESDKEKTVRLITAIFEKQINEGLPLPESFKEFILRIVLHLIHQFKEVMLEDYYKDLLRRAEESLKHSPFYAMMKTSVIDMLSEMIDTILKTRNWKKEMIIKTCLQYIEEHYAEDLFLEAVASKFYFNTSYFSHYFKVNTGISFSQYLLRTRLRKGKELLEETDSKIYEISKLIGFKDTKYFNRVFKKEFGVTPEEYRRITVNIFNANK
ncbi:response regulator [Paenibacillus sp. CGMCC 1.16610]|uniref:Response regulator n=1 Tax=Paenibacillus anseongense TaxID=2682845 RepID=A0ABW9UHV7_9BACL|nr:MULTISPECIES: response regulator [Paenibacillus]MBA2936799.1 response regulator [Paenibacillus sp. CGMCC 1.16610]MVQ39792.1 response regulator [Paenibacillus anseongense]